MTPPRRSPVAQAKLDAYRARNEPTPVADGSLDMERSPVVMEQVIGELVFDRNGKRNPISAGLVVVADYLNSAKGAPTALPLRFSFSIGSETRATVVIDTAEDM